MHDERAFLLWLREELALPLDPSPEAQISEVFDDPLLRFRLWWLMEQFTGEPYAVELMDSLITIRDLYEVHLIKREHS